MPAPATSVMHAQVTSNRSALMLVMTSCPSTAVWPPKYSATMAPMRLSVDASFRAVNRYGIEFGIRTLRRISPSDAAYERMSSRALGSAPDSPRVMLAMTGKNDRTAAIRILDSGLVSPNQALKIGDRAMIGIAFAAIAIGSSRAAAIFQRV